jgi:hypothetical protein
MTCASSGDGRAAYDSRRANMANNQVDRELESNDQDKAARSRPAGKQPIGPALERVLRLENLLRESGSRGLTVREIAGKLDEEGFSVDRRTVQRDLQTLSYCRQVSCTEDSVPRYFATSKPDPKLRLLGHRVAAGGTEPTPRGSRPIRWRSAADYADSLGVSEDAVIDDIRTGTLNGVILRGQWHVLDLVSLDVPDARHPERVLLRIAATRSDNHLTAGTGLLEIALTYDPDAVSRMTGALMPTIADNAPDTVTVSLNGQDFHMDRTLQSDLGAALLLWQIDMDLGPLLAQFPKDFG